MAVSQIGPRTKSARKIGWTKNLAEQKKFSKKLSKIADGNFWQFFLKIFFLKNFFCSAKFFVQPIFLPDFVLGPIWETANQNSIRIATSYDVQWRQKVNLVDNWSKVPCGTGRWELIMSSKGHSLPNQHNRRRIIVFVVIIHQWVTSF